MCIRDRVETELKDDKVLVVFLPDCHESLAGIVAGRIREYYNKSVFVPVSYTHLQEGHRPSYMLMKIDDNGEARFEQHYL